MDAWVLKIRNFMSWMLEKRRVVLRFHLLLLTVIFNLIRNLNSFGICKIKLAKTMKKFATVEQPNSESTYSSNSCAVNAMYEPVKRIFKPNIKRTVTLRTLNWWGWSDCDAVRPTLAKCVSIISNIFISPMIALKRCEWKASNYVSHNLSRLKFKAEKSNDKSLSRSQVT